MKTELIVKDNALINASYNLDLVEQRLILLAILEARESGKGINANDPLTVHAESYINQFGVHRNTAYQALKDACDDLFARQFSYQSLSEKGNVINHKSRWVSEVAYIDNEAVVRLIFAPAIVPLITRLEEQFTKYEIQQISNLTSAYAVRLYEILIAWRSTGKTPLITLYDFRQKIGVLDTEYKRMYDFKKYVLDIALKQVNEHTDITVKVELKDTYFDDTTVLLTRTHCMNMILFEIHGQQKQLEPQQDMDVIVLLLLLMVRRGLLLYRDFQIHET